MIHVVPLLRQCMPLSGDRQPVTQNTAQPSCGASMPRREFLNRSALLGVAAPALFAATSRPAQAKAGTDPTRVYTPPTRKRGPRVINVRNYGAVGNGSRDDTTAFQRALAALPASGGTVYVPPGRYLIDPTRQLRPKSYTHLKLHQDATLIAKPNSAEVAYVIMLYDVTEVEISGGRIIGDRDHHRGTTGEWGHGIQMRGATNITVRDIHISKCWGDGIVVGGLVRTNRPSIPCRRVVIANVVCTHNRRQGLTIGCARNVYVYDSEFSHTHGIKPACGIDIEPDEKHGSETRVIHIENCTMNHNRGNGLVIYKRVYGVTVRLCDAQYNGGYGILGLAATDGFIALNRLQHNKLQGVMLRVGTRNYQISRNVFRNNYTHLFPVNTSRKPVEELAGIIEGRNTTHIRKTGDCRDVRVTPNYYD